MKNTFQTQYMPRYTNKDLAVDLSTPEARKANCRTKQEFKKDCDINLIVKKHKQMGLSASAGFFTAAKQYGDFSQVPTFKEMQDKVHAAQDLFMSLPAHVRQAYGNDPGAFIDAAKTKEGRDLMIKLGLGEEPKAKPKPPSPADSAPKAPDEVLPPSPSGGKK